MKKIGRIVVWLTLTLAIVYLVGPKPGIPELNNNLKTIPAGIGNVEDYISQKNSNLNLRTDNEARIIWANDSLKERTEYSLLYLHGFSASWYEGFPANIEFADYFGCNAYFPRLASHGIETDDALIDMTPDRLWESAKEALMVAKLLGHKVIIMSTSTGGTLALKLASDFPEYVDGLILYSPNIKINNPSAFLLSKPWGLQIGKLVTGSDYRMVNEDLGSDYCKYWYFKYRMEATVFLEQLVELTMTKETWESVNQPVFLGYYFKDEKQQDDVVRVDAMLDMFKHLGTPDSLKVKISFPEARNHVIASQLLSKSYESVIAETILFGENILKLKPVN